jgi:hypothetical protein
MEKSKSIPKPRIGIVAPVLSLTGVAIVWVVGSGGWLQIRRLRPFYDLRVSGPSSGERSEGARCARLDILESSRA